jgi:hypothetical protein
MAASNRKLGRGYGSPSPLARSRYADREPGTRETTLDNEHGSRVASVWSRRERNTRSDSFLMPSFLNPIPPDGVHTEKRKSHELEQREVSSNKKQATSITVPGVAGQVSGSGTRYWMVQWYVFLEACHAMVRRDNVKGGPLSRRNTRHGRGTVSSS